MTSSNSTCRGGGTRHAASAAKAAVLGALALAQGAVAFQPLTTGSAAPRALLLPSTSSSSARSLPSSRRNNDRTALALSPDAVVDSLQTLSQQWDSLVAVAAPPPHAFEASSSSLVLSAAAAAAAAAETTKELGWWDQYLLLFKNTLLFVHSAVDGPLRSAGWDQTWGVSIFLFTASARALLLPLSIQQSKSAEYMKALRPYITQIQEKFKNNENAKNQAVGRLYEDAEQNPLAGCLTSLLQLPIFLGLYRGIRLLALDGELQEPFLWIPSLQGPVSAETDYRGLDWLVKGWTDNPDASGGGFLYVPSLGWETTLAFLVMPVVLVLLQSATMSVLAPPSADDSMDPSAKETMDRTQSVLKFLPLMIGFFSLQVPAGLTIYWFTSNIFTLSSSLAVRAYFKANPPQINLPDYWDTALSGDKDFADMTPEERRQAMEAGIRIGPTMEELVEESKFHFYVDRRNLRFLSSDDGAAATASSSGPLAAIPVEMKDWVESGPTLARPSASVPATAAAATLEEATANSTAYA